MKWWPFGDRKAAVPARSDDPPPAHQLEKRTLEEVLGEDFPAVSALARPRIRLVAAAGAGTDPAGRTKLGGPPDMPDSLAWPDLKGNPLAFVGQIDLDAIARLPGREILSSRGLLLFFYDMELQYGFVDFGRTGFWRVLHATGPAVPRRAPAATHELAIYPEVRLSAASDTQLPDPDSIDYLVELNTELRDQYADAYYDLPRSSGPSHQLFGFPEAVQNDVFQECQLDANGLGEAGRKGMLDPEWPALKLGVKDWRLLLQVDSDDQAGMLWGDAGMLYFCIRDEDLREADFEKVWMVFQCC